MLVFVRRDEVLLELADAGRIALAFLLPPQIRLLANGHFGCCLKRFEYIIEVLLAVDVWKAYILNVSVEYLFELCVVFVKFEPE